MAQIIKEERSTFTSGKSESNDSQNINGSIKESQNSLEDEEEYNSKEIIEVFNEIGQMKKKKKNVSFANEKSLVTIIEIESYKEYNSPIEMGRKNILKAKNKKFSNKKKRKDTSYIREDQMDYLDSQGNSGKSCLIF